MSSPILLYDDTCAFCAASVQFVLRHERAPVLRFAPLGGITAHQVRARHAGLADLDSLVLVTNFAMGDECVQVRSNAALAAARYLTWPWRLLTAPTRIVPRPARDRLYDLVAHHRHQLAGDQCLVPTSDTRDRFLD